MDQKQIVTQMISFNKSTFDSSFNTMIALQDQAEKMVFGYLDKATWFPEEGRKAVNEWMDTYKKARENFKYSYDENYKKISDYFMKFAQEEKAAKTTNTK